MLLGLALISGLLIVVESTTRLLEPVRGAIGTTLSPLVFVAEIPYQLGGEVGDALASRSSLQADNEALRRRLLELGQVSQQFVALKAENERLRALLGSRARVTQEVLIAEIVGVVPRPDTYRIIIDKGRDAGVAEGQAVLDSEGLFGQVVEVSQYTSQVLLITDAAHAVPVRINRTGLRTIAGGTGRIDRLDLEDVPVTADIRKGDLVVTSGLGGRFPSGYPVGTVVSVSQEPTAAFSVVGVRPGARLDRSQHVLVLFAPNPEMEDEPP